MKIIDNLSRLRAVAVVSVWAILLTAVAATATAEVLNCGWRDSFSTSVVDDDVKALAIYDDGTGDPLYVGGYFTNVRGLPVNHITRWDGAAWSALAGPYATGISGWTRALASDGAVLFAGGSFVDAGGMTSWKVAEWSCDVRSFFDGFENGGTSL